MPGYNQTETSPPAHSSAACLGGAAFVVDPNGKIYVYDPCGQYYSGDGGATWQGNTLLPGILLAMVADKSRTNRFVANIYTGSTAGLFESLDAGATWQPLPAPAQTMEAFDVDASGAVWIATTDGVYTLDVTAGTWSARSGGIFATAIDFVLPSLADRLVLLSANDGTPIQSFDEAVTWQPYLLNGQIPGEVTANVNVAGSLLASTNAFLGHDLYGSSDAGTTWHLIKSNPTTPSGQHVAGGIPVGPQPGLVYGLHETCDVSGFGGCFWTPHGVAKSVDGGVTWVEMDNGLAAGTYGIVVSPADPSVAFVFDFYVGGLYVTRDGGSHWQKTSLTSRGSVIADPVDPSRVYFTDDAGNLFTSTDYATTWTPLTHPPVSSSGFYLLVDSDVHHTLYAVGLSGEVELSNDSGAHWQSIVAPSTFKLNTGATLLLGPEPPRIYAGTPQGVLKLTLPDSQPAIPTLGASALLLLTMLLAMTTFVIRRGNVALNVA